MIDNIVCWFSFKITLMNIFRVSNGSDPFQTWQVIGLGLDPSCLQGYQQTMRLDTSRQTVIIYNWKVDFLSPYSSNFNGLLIKVNCACQNLSLFEKQILLLLLIIQSLMRVCLSICLSVHLCLSIYLSVRICVFFACLGVCVSVCLSVSCLYVP